MIIEYLASEGGGISLLDVNPGLAIWTTVIFGIVFLILKFFAWGPIARALDARAEKIHTDIDRADSIRKEAEDRLADYMAKIENLNVDAERIVAAARKEAGRVKEELLEAARKEAEAQREKGVREVNVAAQQALDRLHQEVATLSVSIAGQILGRSISTEDHRELIQATLDQLKSSN